MATILCGGLAGCVAAPPRPLPPPAPAARVEAVPPPAAPRVVWLPGGWHMKDGSYVWVPAHKVVHVAAHRHWLRGHHNAAGAWVAGHWVTS